MRHGIPLAFLCGCALFLWPVIQSQDAEQLGQAWHAIAPADWILAAVFTAISFLAIGQYDVIAHRQLDTGLPAEQARQSGIAAIALSQTIGFGLVTASLVRWRLLRGFGPGVAAVVTMFVSLTFIVAMVTLTALACVFLPTPQYLARLSLCAVPIVLGLLYLTLRHPRLTLRGFLIELPGVRATFAATGWAALDMGAACFALWLLIPEIARPDLLAFLPAFCLALSAGLLSGTPAGVGPFEVVLFALCATGMPAETDMAALLVAIVGFRLVYFALPACLAAIMLLVRRERISVERRPGLPDLHDATRAETCVIRQNGGRIEELGVTHAGLWPTGQALVAMYDPFDAPGPGFFDCLAERARDRNRFALIYKAGAETALAARHAGWVCLHSADDAIIDTARFDLDTPERAGLRRKLRKAARSGLRVRDMQPGDLTRLAEIDGEWQASQGRARGGSMGRFCASYLAAQRVLIAEAEDRVVGFASFQVCKREWALDMMRHGDGAPDGTMHALVHAGIEAATSAGMNQVSLAAVPACPDPASAIWRSVAFKLVGQSGGTGLRQFKSSFAPRWKPLYLAAPSRLALGIAALDVAREVFFPSEIGSGSVGDLDHRVNRPHEEDEIYEVASNAAA